MRNLIAGVFCLSLTLAGPAFAQENNLNRKEVTALKAKLVTVRDAMGADPAGYIRNDEDFSLPTSANPAQAGKFWPITSSVSLRYVDRASVEGPAEIDRMMTEFQTRYAEAMASGDPDVIAKMVEEMTQLQTQATAAAMASATHKEPMQVYVQFNMNPSVSIDPDEIVLERPGVIALREKELTSERGQVTVYIDPVVLNATEELSQFELRTPNDGVTNKMGVYHVVITANGTVADIETWVNGFDLDAMLTVFDPR